VLYRIYKRVYKIQERIYKRGYTREKIESLANTRATATAIWSSTIALILKDKGECKLHLHGLKRCAMP
jgi:hypothetical protein